MRKLKGHGQENNILQLTWPIFIELVLQMLVGNADQIMVGWNDPNGVGAIGNANQILNLLLIVFSVVCTAAMILISQYIGAKDTRSVGQIYNVSLVTNFIFGVAISLLLILLCGPIFRLMGVKEAFFEQACTYIRIVGGGMCLQAVYLTFTAFFRSSQMMKETMMVSVAVNLINIGGNAILINGAFGIPAMGVAGAAVSSVASRVVGIVVIYVLFRKRFGRVLSLRYLKPFPKVQLKKLLSIGIPAGGESMSYGLSQIVIQTICNGFAAFVVNTRVYASMFAMVSYIFGAAIGQAAQVVVARLMGAGEVDETDKQVKRTLFWSVLIATIASTTLFLGARPLFSIFTKDPQVLELCVLIMLIEIPLEMGRGVNTVMCRTLQACGDIRFPIIICVFSAWIPAVGGGLILGVFFEMGLAGLWIAMAVDECLRALLFLWRWRSGTWRNKRILEDRSARADA